MGVTNQVEIFRQQRKSAYLSILSKLKIARDSLDIQAFAHTPEEEMGDTMMIATDLTALIEKVKGVLSKGGAQN